MHPYAPYKTNSYPDTQALMASVKHIKSNHIQCTYRKGTAWTNHTTTDSVMPSGCINTWTKYLPWLVYNSSGKEYSAFKLKELDKSEEPKALLSIDSMLNWSDHEGEDEEKGAAQVYGMIAGDDDDAAGDASGDVSDAAAEFALMGLSSQVQAYKNTLQTLEQQKAWYQSNQLALEERIRILTADLENTTNMLKYTEKLNDQVKLDICRGAL
ncbi:hypothetical protein Tco_0521917 [Tanacetum coccineum]